MTNQKHIERQRGIGRALRGEYVKVSVDSEKERMNRISHYRKAFRRHFSHIEGTRVYAKSGGSIEVFVENDS